MSRESNPESEWHPLRGLAQMAGGVVLSETGMFIPNLVWGIGTIVCGTILSGYGLKDFLGIHRSHENHEQ